jgi:hypothetical protein
MRNVWLVLFLRASNVTWLSVNIVIVLSSISVFSMYSIAHSIANCSAWLFVHHLFNLYCKFLRCFPSLNIAMPAPTLCSDLLPSVNICVELVDLLLSVTMVIVSAGCCQSLTTMVQSNSTSSPLLLLVS